jgi:hypothetical protein
MEHRDDIHKEVELTLNSLDGVERAETRPFFYARLTARLQQESEAGIWGKMILLLSRPAISLAILLTFLLINGYLLFSSLSSRQEAEQMDYVSQQISYFDTNLPTP